MAELLVEAHNLVKIYKVADLEVVALQGLDLHVPRGEMLALVGPSGAGKSTLLNILGGLDEPSAGRCDVAGVDLTRISPSDRLLYRRRVVGHIWQQTSRNLLTDLSLIDNVVVPMVMAGYPGRRRQRAKQLLELVGLGHRMSHKPSKLSGGEQQRGALAVALANNPELLLADEPTGELDNTTAGEVLKLLRALNAELGLTTIVVTHDPVVAGAMDRLDRDPRWAHEHRGAARHGGRGDGDHRRRRAAANPQTAAGITALRRTRARAYGRWHLEVWPAGVNGSGGDDGRGR